MELRKKKMPGDSNRWKHWDYSSPAAYYITINSFYKRKMFGRVKDGCMIYSAEGKIVADEFFKIPEYNKRLILDEWVVMPDHVHCIIVLMQDDYDNQNSSSIDLPIPPLDWNKVDENPHIPDDFLEYRNLRRRMIIPKVLGKFQMLTSQAINDLNQTPGQKNWTPDCYDHIIRNMVEYRNIKRYIRDNPKNWGKKG
jgi:putative transposase